ncbi:hypothetical protein V8G54_006630, partial [Vigna mungo]
MAASSVAESSCDAPSLSSSAETNTLSSILRHFSFQFPVLVVAPSPLHTRTCSTTTTSFSLLSFLSVVSQTLISYRFIPLRYFPKLPNLPFRFWVRRYKAQRLYLLFPSSTVSS